MAIKEIGDTGLSASFTNLFHTGLQIRYAY
jgi:hypothetical protein